MDYEHGPRLEYVATGSDADAATAVAQKLGGTLYIDKRAAGDSVFKTLLRVVTDTPEDLDPASDVGRYLVVARTIRPRPPYLRSGAPLPGPVALFPMVRRPDLARRVTDAYWRDNHAPLALYHHIGMLYYTQLSVMHVFAGPAYDGFAACGFASEEELQNRFYDGPEGRVAIGADVAKFADTQNSPRRVVASEWRF